MKAILVSINQLWFVVIPPTDTLFPEMEIEMNPKRYAMPIYRVKEITDTQNWKQKLEVEGDIIRENKKNYFKLKDVTYLPSKTEDNSRTLTLIKGILGGFNHTSITIEQYNYIHQVAKSENLISSYFNNGYCVNYKYVIYGKLTKDKKIIYPQIKIKEK